MCFDNCGQEEWRRCQTKEYSSESQGFLPVCLPDPLFNESVRHLSLLFGRELARMLGLSRQLLPRDRTYLVSARSKAGSAVEGRFRDTR